MTRWRTPALIAAAAIVGLTLLAFPTPSAQAASSTQSIVAQTTYYCLASATSTSDPSSTANYNVTARMQLNTPTTVAPGGTLDLRGVLTLQFDEALYRNAKLVGVTSVDGYSDSMSVTSLINGKRVVVPANRWQTAPQPLSDPIIVSAPITFHPYTVPRKATGSMVVGLMQNGTVKNQISNSPPKVAFTAVANATYGGGQIMFNLACYLPSGAPGTLGKIAIVAPQAANAPTQAPAPGGSTTGGSSSTLTTSTGGGTGGGTTGESTPPAGAGSGGTTGRTASSATGSTGARTGTAQTVAAQSSGATQTQSLGTVAADTTSNRSGIYIPTGLLVFGGVLVCLAALAYAGLANYRLRTIQRAFDD